MVLNGYLILPSFVGGIEESGGVHTIGLVGCGLYVSRYGLHDLTLLSLGEAFPHLESLWLCLLVVVGFPEGLKGEVFSRTRLTIGERMTLCVETALEESTADRDIGVLAFKLHCTASVFYWRHRL